MPLYTANWRIKNSGTVIQPGQAVELPEKAAAALVASGALSPAPVTPKPVTSSTKSSTEGGDKNPENPPAK